MNTSQPSSGGDEGTDKILQWLESFGMGGYIEVFRTNEITWELLPKLTMEDLKECGVNILGHRKLIFSKIHEQPPESDIAHSETSAAQPVPTAKPKAILSGIPLPSYAMAIETPTPDSEDSIVSDIEQPPPFQESPSLNAASNKPIHSREMSLRKALGNKVILISIVAHILFIIIAAFLIVQTIQAKRKVTFQGGPPSPNASTRALEHKMNMTRKNQTMSAPAQAKRITTTGLSKVTLPEMPPMLSATDIVPEKMAGTGGTGVGLGVGNGVSGGGNGAGGNIMPYFGMRDMGGGSLAGTLYDLKQTRDGNPTNMAIANEDRKSSKEKAPNSAFESEVANFCRGWDDSKLEKFYRSPKPLYTTQIFIPTIRAEEGPKQFGVGKKVQPRRWLVHYQGNVIPPESGTYRFVGFGDDILTVKFNGRVVLDAGQIFPGNKPPRKWYPYDGVDKDKGQRGCGVGDVFQVDAGKSYKIDILLGEQPGGDMKAWLLLEKQGADYKKDSKRNPILPIFKLAPSEVPKPKQEAPVFAADTPWSIWRAEKQLMPGASFSNPF